MMRLLFLLLIFFPAFFVEADELAVQFIGNMAFRITDGKNTIYSDFPYKSGAFGYMKYDGKFLKNDPAAVSLITHAHNDHWDNDLFNRLDWKVIGPKSVQNSIDSSRVIPVTSKTEWNGISIEPIETPHANIDHYSYLVTWHGLRLYFTGDTESTEKLLSMKDLDVAFVSPWLAAEIVKNKQKIDASKVVIYHHTDDEKVVDFQSRIVPKSSESFIISK